MGQLQSPVDVEIDYKIRGRYLVACAEIETLLTEIIARHFCDTSHKRETLIELFVNERASLNRKIEILGKILNDYPAFTAKNGDIIVRLTKVRKLRNKLAHYRRVGEPKGSDATLSLQYFQDGKLKTESISAVTIKIRTYQAFDIRYDLWRILYMVSNGKSKLLPRVKGKATILH